MSETYSLSLINNQGHLITVRGKVDSTWLERFYIGGIDCEIDYRTHYQNLNTLGFSLWHKYLSTALVDGKEFPFVHWYDNSVPNDSLHTPIEDYASALRGKINAIYEYGKGRKLIMCRPKIDYLCYGQRSDYQCEPVSMDDDLWFYAFNYHHPTVPVEIEDDGSKVIHCRTATVDRAGDAPGYVVLGLRANTEQCKDEEGWRGDAQSQWLIKPRIRMDSNVVNNPLNWEKLVCRIEIINATGSLIKSFDIRVRNFLQSNADRYNGEYREEFFFSQWGDSSQLLNGSWQDTLHWAWIYAARGDSSNWYPNRADIRVYWYGNCDMWIDYIRVDNEVADELFKGLRDDWIWGEAVLIGGSNNSAIMKYYLEYAEFNNLPCITYVNKKLKEFSNNKIDLIQDLSYTISHHVPWKERRRILNAKFLYKYYIQATGYTQVFAESYPLTACYTCFRNSQNFSKIPNTLPFFSTSNCDSILASYVSTGIYEVYLQDNLNHMPNYLEADGYTNTECQRNEEYLLKQDQGNFRFILQLCDSISKLGNIPFIFMPQIHQNFRPGEVRREPTNEELDMITNVALTYGAKGLMYFSYLSWHSSNNKEYVIGIMEDNDSSVLREMNFYHQTNPGKKETIISIVNHINKWAPLLLSFKNSDRHSYIYDFRNERESLKVNSYFEGFLTLVPGNRISVYNEDIFPPSYVLPARFVADCQKETYLQIATFGSRGDTTYFMVVNRRCSPPNSADTVAGRRRVHALVRTDSCFALFEKWEVINCESNKIITTFQSSDSLAVLDLGWFMPGEGKLFKICPVTD
ncbi:MAG: hypothetical protein ACPL2D_04250 [Ignavibacteria bacterium]